MSVLEQWDRFIEAFLEKLKEHPRLWKGELSKDEAESYLSYYGVNSGLFIESDSQGVCGFMTVHPGVKDFDWSWDAGHDCCTVHLCWAKSKDVLKRMMLSGLKRFLPKSVHYIRDGCIVTLTPKKVERLATYGRR